MARTCSRARQSLRAREIMDGQVCPGRFWGWDWGRGEGVIWLLNSAHPLVLPTGDRAMNKRPSFYLTPKAEHGYHKTDAHRCAGLPSQLSGG